MPAAPLRKPGVIMRWIDPIHRWTGAIMGVLLAAMGLSGTLLIHEDAWLRATVPHASDARASDVTAYAPALERLMADPTRPANVIFPSDSLGVFTLSFGEGAGAYADASGAIVSRWETKWERPEVWLFDFHHHLFSGEAGTTAVGILALIGLAFVVTGIALWWQNRKNFKLRAVPSGLSRRQIVRHHRDLGLVMSPLLIVLFLTGSMLVFRPIADVLFAPLSPAGTITASLEQPTVKGAKLAANFDWSALLQVVRNEYPEGQLRGLSVPRREGQLIRVRVKQPAEWLPNGRTMMWFDPGSGRLVDSRDATTLPLATRAYNIVYPIHASKVGGVIYKLVMTAAGLTLVMLGSLAVYAFWGFRMRRESRVTAALASER
jgi:uncharacterized iron-regulated membrane protein